jgi:FkbM family methyltransferase
MLHYVKEYLDATGITFSKWMVEVGAYHWEEGSRSKEFIDDGWNVLLVEPHPHLYIELSKKYSGNPNVTLLEYAVSDKSGMGTLFEGANGPTDGCHTMFPMKKRYGIEGIKEIKVVTKTLTEIFDKLNIPKDLAFLSIDTEGMDLEVLLGLDLETYKPRLVLSENTSFNSHLEALREKLTHPQSRGCATHRLRPDWQKKSIKGSLDSDVKNQRKHRLLVSNNYVSVGGGIEGRPETYIDSVYVIKK